MEWQLNEIASEEPYLDYTFPLEQMNGANAGPVEAMTVRHPLLMQRDAENYIAALGEVRGRLADRRSVEPLSFGHYTFIHSHEKSPP